MIKNIDFINTFFSEEKIESLFFIIIGIIAILLAALFLFIIKYSFYKGIAIPLLLIGTIQVFIGINNYNLSLKHLKKIEHPLNNNLKNTPIIEQIRMEAVIRDFNIYKWIEIVFIICGIIVYLIFSKSSQVFWKGIGLGLLIQSSLMLTLNLIAEDRRNSYTHSIKIHHQ